MDQTSLRSLFEVNNARNQSIDEVVSTFVPSDSFWRLLNGKNHILLGSRGSGKTAVLRMLAHDHLCRFSHPQVRALISSRSFIGTFVPMRADWLGTLKNKPWLGEDDREPAFKWRLNLSCCVAFIDTAESCLETYVAERDRPFASRDLARMLANAWSSIGSSVNLMQDLRRMLEDIEWQRQLASMDAVMSNQSNGHDGPGSAFDLELFSPIARGIQMLKRVIKFPKDTIWILALDELEFLQEYHHELINTFLRGRSAVAFKLSTMPYFHHTLRTKTSQPIVAGNDFDYVYLDNDPSIRRTDRRGWTSWANEVLSSRIAYVSRGEHPHFRLEQLLGDETPLVDEKPSDWGRDSRMMGLLRKFSNEVTWERALKLPSDRFKDEISRKMHGLLLLREQASKPGGHRKHELYSGPKMFALCSDANPRQLIRLFNELTLFRSSTNDLNMGSQISHVRQSECVIQFSGDALRNASIEEGVGGQLHEFIRTLMLSFQGRFYNRRLSTDYYYSILLPDDVPDEYWKLIRYAVGLGLMFPKVGFANPDELPGRSNSVFDLAFRLAPKFGLLPRKGRALSLGEALRSRSHASTLAQVASQLELL